MKTSEILLASGVVACVAAAATTLAVRAFQAEPERASTARAAGPGESGAALLAGADQETQRVLTDLWMENDRLHQRLAALERLVAERPARTPVETQAAEAPAEEWSGGIPGFTAIADDGSVVVTPSFVASVGRALEAIEAEEEAVREARRREIQAQRIEERVAEMQLELGLSRDQAADVRGALIAQDDRRDELFASMRDGEGDPRDMREQFRVLRDEADETMRSILTPAQFETYRESERDSGGWGRGGFDRGGERGDRSGGDAGGRGGDGRRPGGG